MHGAQIAGMSLHQGRRNQGIAEQLLRAVDIGNHFFEQPGTLQRAGFNLLPVVMADNQRKQINRPRPLRAILIGVDVVGDPVVAYLSGQFVGPSIKILQTIWVDLTEKFGPVSRQRRLRATNLSPQLIKVLACGVGCELTHGLRQRAGCSDVGLAGLHGAGLGSVLIVSGLT